MPKTHNFTFVLENYYPEDSRAYVIYTASDKNIPPRGQWVYISPTWDSNAIEQAIISAYPANQMRPVPPANANISALVGEPRAGEYSEPIHVPAEPIVDESSVRITRDSLLSLSDWTQLADAPLSAALRAEWAVYRQSLRDVPAQSGFPLDVIWPAAPGE